MEEKEVNQQDRSKEILSQTDTTFVVARQLLLAATKTVEHGGSRLGTDDSYYDIRAIERDLPPNTDWLDALKDQMYPTGGSF